MIDSLNAPADDPKCERFRASRFWVPAVLVVLVLAAATAALGSATPLGTSSSGVSGPLQNAINAAKQYLQSQAFSRQGLIDQLDSSFGDQYSVSVATAAVDSLNVNWSGEAVKAAKQYLQNQSFSCQGLIQQLSSSYGDKFTLAQAEYAASSVRLCGTGSTSSSGSTSSGGSVAARNATRAAKQYLQTQAFSKQGLIDQLDSSAGDKYSVGVATAAVNSLNVNWNTEAVKAAKEYLQSQAFSCQGLIQQLSSSYGDKFTLAQARYAARRVGLC